ncbi:MULTISPECIES: SAM-dependent methyltransferase [unclassified Bacillus (in: firmicutes)]|uniref:SAM-dependent methyltransferase n=1 Tax=unclassified Bacillus (in: firmicutes) TaxID=185979 RepID=UPI000BF77253|nr:MULTISPECIES: SAM-dependent methyltransferase [unclassified Bacillus (in: firmicutes)]PEU18132.1 hypothetical protein CN525_13010 [Bacillus sp. AFS014408]PFW62401.1 hypothetical protein COL20_13220 [Bacillus sp. AFS075034]
MLSKDKFQNLLQLLNNFQSHQENPDWIKHPLQQQLLLLGLHELGSFIEDEYIRHTIQDMTSKTVQELNGINMKEDQPLPLLSKTPLIDFLSRFSNQEFLDKYNKNPQEVLDESGLREEYRYLIKNGNRGLLRIRATQELEKAGLAPMITDKYDLEEPEKIQYTNYNLSNTVTTNITIDMTVNTIYNTNHIVIQDHLITNWFDKAMESITSAVNHFSTPNYEKQGRLTIVGSGIKAISDFTLGALEEIRAADKVLYCVADPVTEQYIHKLNATAESMYGMYDNDKPRMNTYQEMVEEMLKYVREDKRVCVVFYGHPGVFAWSPHQAIRIARNEGYYAVMQPGISAEASLFADLGLDQSNFGFQSFDSTEMLVNDRTIDPYSHVILWQVECAADNGFNFTGYQMHNFPLVLEKLLKVYPANHPIIIYEASQWAQYSPQILKIPLNKLSTSNLTGICTLYIPPIDSHPMSEEMLKKLKLVPPEDEQPKSSLS